MFVVPCQEAEIFLVESKSSSLKLRRSFCSPLGWKVDWKVGGYEITILPLDFLMNLFDWIVAWSKVK